MSPDGSPRGAREIREGTDVAASGLGEAGKEVRVVVRPRDLVFLLLAAAVSGLAAWSPRPSAGATTATVNPPGLLVIYGSDAHASLAAFTLAGAKVPVPALAPTSAVGLSPDSRYVAAIPGSRPGVTDYGLESTVDIRPLNGKSARIVISGTGPAFAWSPTGRRLAASANRQAGVTQLRLYDRGTGQIQSLKLPASHLSSSRALFRVLSWSPDGSRLLLEESNPYLPVAIVALDLRSKALTTLARFGDKDEPSTIWSPNGRYVALANGEGWVSTDYLFAVIDAASGDPVMQCSGARHCSWVPAWPLAWASDSRSLFARSRRGIERLDLAWHHSLISAVHSQDSISLTSTKDRLAYTVVVWKPDMATGDYTPWRDTLYLVDLTTNRKTQLLQVHGTNQTILQVRALQHLP